jgi:hypothetical protein
VIRGKVEWGHGVCVKRGRIGGFANEQMSEWRVTWRMVIHTVRLTGLSDGTASSFRRPLCHDPPLDFQQNRPLRQSPPIPLLPPLGFSGVIPKHEKEGRSPWRVISPRCFSASACHHTRIMLSPQRPARRCRQIRQPSGTRKTNEVGPEGERGGTSQIARRQVQRPRHRRFRQIRQPSGTRKTNEVGPEGERGGASQIARQQVRHPAIASVVKFVNRVERGRPPGNRRVARRASAEARVKLPADRFSARRRHCRQIGCPTHPNHQRRLAKISGAQ